MLRELLQYQFLQNALIAGVFASIVSGIIGVIIVEKKLIMMSGGIAHTSYGGVGLGYLLNFEPILGAFLFSTLAALGVGLLKRKGGTDSDIVIGLFWSLGMALGIVFIALMPGYPPNLGSYLFGNILAVTRSDLVLIIILTIIVAAVFLVFFNNWKAYLFDEEFAGIRGIPTVVLEFLLLVLIAMTVVVLIRLVGIILCLSLLIAPAATAKLLFRKLKTRIFAAIILGIVFTVAGLFISYFTEIGSGAVIVLVSILSYMLAYGLTAFAAGRRRAEASDE